MSTIRRNGEYTTDIIEGGMLLYNNDDVIIFNETAVAIWSKLAQPIDAKNLIDELAQEYETSYDEIETLSLRFLKQLRNAGIIIIED